MSNFIIRQQGPSSVVADNLWEIRPSLGSLLVGALAMVVIGRYLGRRQPGAGARTPQGWPVNFAHRGGAKIAPENTLEGFREGLRVGAGVLELDVHATADGTVVVHHDEKVDRTTDGSGAIREMTLADVRRLDAGYRFTPDGGRTYPYRGEGVRIPTMEEVYREFADVPINVEIKGKRPGIEEAVWRNFAAKTSVRPITGAPVLSSTRDLVAQGSRPRRDREPCILLATAPSFQLGTL